MLSTQDLLPLIDALAGTRILVVGDLMLDRFVHGEVERISPESPVPILRVTREILMAGGSGNVAANLAGLGVQATLVSVVGHDEEGRTLSARLDDTHVSCAGLVTSTTRPTTIKTRFLASHQQLLRVDEETAAALSVTDEQAVLAKIAELLPTQQAVIVSDYGKGVLTGAVTARIIELARARNIPVLVDPKGSDYSRYRGASVVTPNRKELAEATRGSPTVTDENIVAAAMQIIGEAGIDAVMATRSQDGLSIVRLNADPVHLRTQALEVFDVSGAGDTVIATAAAVLAAGGTLEQAGQLANLAGGVVVAKVGTAAIRTTDLLAALDHAAGGVSSAEIDDWHTAREQVERWKARGLKVGFTNGCFDILHAGHVNYLAEARSYCDRLIIGLNHDKSVRILKGPTRPVNDQSARATVLSGLAAVDMVVLFGATENGSDNTPCALIDLLKPDIYFKGGDYKPEQLPEAKIVAAYGGETKIMGLTAGHSTTSTIARMTTGKVA